MNAEGNDAKQANESRRGVNMAVKTSSSLALFLSTASKVTSLLVLLLVKSVGEQLIGSGWTWLAFR